MNRGWRPLELMKGERHKSPHDSGFGMDQTNIDIYNSIYDRIALLNRTKKPLDTFIKLLLSVCKVSPNCFDMSLMWYIGVVPFVANNQLYIAVFPARLSKLLQYSKTAISNYFQSRTYIILHDGLQKQTTMKDNSVFFNFIPHVINLFVLRVVKDEYYNELFYSIPWIKPLAEQNLLSLPKVVAPIRPVSIYHPPPKPPNMLQHFIQQIPPIDPPQKQPEEDPEYLASISLPPLGE
jgi:hypothetical protein